MAEYIERQAVLSEYDRQHKGTPGGARRIIETFPAADVRPVVRCCECKFAPIGDKDGSDLEWPFNEYDENHCPCKCLDNRYSHKPAPDFFCAAGEKREENKE